METEAGYTRTVADDGRTLICCDSCNAGNDGLSPIQHDRDCPRKEAGRVVA